MGERSERPAGAASVIVRTPIVLAVGTAATMVAFAANSLLCRGALGPGRADPASFTAIRLASGAVVLGLLVRGRGRSVLGGGRWAAAIVLVGYALCFSWGYVRVTAGAGALVLFLSVQWTMLGWALGKGSGPRGLQWAGVMLSVAGLAALTLPGIGQPDAVGVILMAASGIAWGVYTIFGRGSTDPVGDTAGNFARAALATGLVLAALSIRGGLHASPTGWVLAMASGALASGLGYVLWYTVLPGLGVARASVIQLSVPVLAAVGGIVLFGEPASGRLAVSAAAILGGIALATRPADR